MLGTAVIDKLKSHYNVIATDLIIGYSPDNVNWHIIDLCDTKALKIWIKEEKPDVVIHCAAIVNVDECEKNPFRAEALHVKATESIASVLAGWNGKLIYISTDSVFNGLKEGLYNESDTVNPLNVYAKTKYKGELETQKTKRGLVIRTNIFGWSRAEKTSFAEWILKSLIEHEQIRMFKDVMYSPIHVSHLSDVLIQLVNKDICGLYHVCGESSLSKYTFAIRMSKIFGLDTELIIGGSIDEVAFKAVRPKNMALSCEKIQRKTGNKLPDVISGIYLMKEQYDSGWVSKIKGRDVSEQYRFWEVDNGRDNH